MGLVVIDGINCHSLILLTVLYLFERCGLDYVYFGLVNH